MPPAAVTRQSPAWPRKRRIAAARPEVKNSSNVRLGRVRRVVGSVRVELRLASSITGSPPPVIPVPRAAHPEVDPPRAVHQHAPVAIGAQRHGLVEVDHRRLAARAPRQAGARERELALLRLQIAQLHAGPAELPSSPRPTARRPAPASRTRSGRRVVSAHARRRPLEPDDLHALADLDPRRARPRRPGGAPSASRPPSRRGARAAAPRPAPPSPASSTRRYSRQRSAPTTSSDS